MRTEFHIDSDQIACLYLNHPHKAVNVLDEETLQEIQQHISRFVDDDAIKGLVIASKKPSFIAGVDLSLLGNMADKPATHFRDFLLSLHQSMRALETCPKPVVAAINGTVLGGGLELCLCADYRIGVIDSPGQIGLPETKLGIFPGMGGSVRLPRLIGLQAALEIILKGATVNFSKAKMLSLVHELVPEKSLLSRAKEWILANQHVDNPINHLKNYRTLNPYHPKSANILMGANSIARSQSRGLYQNSQLALQCIYETLSLEMDLALKVEADYFSQCLFHPHAQAMIKTLFLHRKELATARHAPLQVDQDIKRIGIVGAGFMGSGIACHSACSGLEVVLIDRDDASLAKAHETIQGILDKGIKNKKLSDSKEAYLSRIKFTTHVSELRGCDLVIEAVFEERNVKKDMLEAIEKEVDSNCIIASNTSTLPITSLANYLKKPQRFVGIHFFSPVHLMQLVEVIKGQESSDWAISMAVKLVQIMKKVSIIVNDGRGFYTTRVVISYLNEGMRLLREGVSPAIIENAGRAIGMPVGPLALADEIALDLALKIRLQTQKDLGDAWQDDGLGDLLEWMVNENGRCGRKSGQGFYEYPEGREKYLWPGLKTHFPQTSSIPYQTVKDRLLRRQLEEVKRVQEEGILTDAKQINVGAILGFGFCPWSGGPTYLLSSLKNQA